MSDTWTIGRLLTWTTDYLAQHGSDSPRLEAEVLLAHARGCQRIMLYTAFEEPAAEELRNRFRALVKRRSEGMPVAYLVGHREFYSLDFRVTPDVLIPRPETELLVLTLLDTAKALGPRDAPPAIVDVGTGSGIIAVTAARHLPQAQVTAIDISPAALAIASENAQKHAVAERITFLEGDLLAALPSGQVFDIVASNPPYVSTAEMADLPRDVRDFEPHQALSAGPTGTTVIERLIPQAADRLKPGGTLLIEISPMIAQPVEALVQAEPRFELLKTLKDGAGQARLIQARRK